MKKLGMSVLFLTLGAISLNACDDDEPLYPVAHPDALMVQVDAGGSGCFTSVPSATPAK